RGAQALPPFPALRGRLLRPGVPRGLVRGEEALRPLSRDRQHPRGQLAAFARHARAHRPVLRADRAEAPRPQGPRAGALSCGFAQAAPGACSARIRSSIGGCEANSAIQPDDEGAMPNADIDCGSSPCSSAPRRWSAWIMGWGPSRRAEPASARNSRRRENQATMSEARTPNTIWNAITVTKQPGPTPRSVRNTAL